MLLSEWLEVFFQAVASYFFLSHDDKVTFNSASYVDGRHLVVASSSMPRNVSIVEGYSWLLGHV